MPKDNDGYVYALGRIATEAEVEDDLKALEFWTVCSLVSHASPLDAMTDEEFKGAYERYERPFKELSRIRELRRKHSKS